MSDYELDEVARCAAELDCQVVREDDFEGSDHPELNLGPYVLRDLDGYDIWAWRLPLVGIVDALDCLEKELAGDEKAWGDFGMGWRSVAAVGDGA